MKTTGILAVLLLTLFVFGCETPASRINGVSIGMTKAQVLAVMGPPDSITADRKAEYLNYALAEKPGRGAYFTSTETPYQIRLVNGKVESYGRADTATHTSQVVPTVR